MIPSSSGDKGTLNSPDRSNLPDKIVLETARLEVAYNGRFFLPCEGWAAVIMNGSMFAIAFDLEMAQLTALYPGNSPNNAYSEIKRRLGALGFNANQSCHLIEFVRNEGLLEKPPQRNVRQTELRGGPLFGRPGRDPGQLIA